MVSPPEPGFQPSLGPGSENSARRSSPSLSESRQGGAVPQNDVPRARLHLNLPYSPPRGALTREEKMLLAPTCLTFCFVLLFVLIGSFCFSVCTRERKIKFYNYKLPLSLLQKHRLASSYQSLFHSQIPVFKVPWRFSLQSSIVVFYLGFLLCQTNVILERNKVSQCLEKGKGP